MSNTPTFQTEPEAPTVATFSRGVEVERPDESAILTTSAYGDPRRSKIARSISQTSNIAATVLPNLKPNARR